MKNFLYLFISDIGTLTKYSRAYLVAFSNKQGRVKIEDADILSAEEIGQMYGGNWLGRADLLSKQVFQNEKISL